MGDGFTDRHTVFPNGPLEAVFAFCKIFYLIRGAEISRLFPKSGNEIVGRQVCSLGIIDDDAAAAY